MKRVRWVRKITKAQQIVNAKRRAAWRWRECFDKALEHAAKHRAPSVALARACAKFADEAARQIASRFPDHDDGDF